MQIDAKRGNRFPTASIISASQDDERTPMSRKISSRQQVDAQDALRLAEAEVRAAGASAFQDQTISKSDAQKFVAAVDRLRAVPGGEDLYENQNLRATIQRIAGPEREIEGVKITKGAKTVFGAYPDSKRKS